MMVDVAPNGTGDGSGAVDAAALFDFVAANVEGLRLDCVAFSNALGGWVAAKRRATKDAQDRHNADLLTCSEKLKVIDGETNVVQARTAELEQLAETEKMEEVKMEGLLSDLVANRAKKEAARLELESKLKRMERELHERRRELDRRVEEREREVARNVPDMLAFEDKLAMKIHSIKDGVIRIVFTHVNERNWDEEFDFVVDVTGDRTFKSMS
ncbi:hypothetical protein HK405_002811 [Cladochytrium tenue]|nr:hypothetical protein HK405_002811 [Cladochytrium tenue]